MRIILVGFGVVGRSIAEVILEKTNLLAKNYGISPKVVAIVDSQGCALDPRGLDLKQALVVKKDLGSISHMPNVGVPRMTATEVIENTDSEIMIDVVPTNTRTGEPGLTHMKTALRTGKHVVTANKGPLALALPSLTELAVYNRVQLRFGGAVGAGTPILEFAKKCLLGSEILSAKGILNGTTNFILTAMADRKIDFSAALKEAQDLGYAETDPSNDIKGIDTASKLVIIANWVMGMPVTLSDVDIKGIEDVTVNDIEEARTKRCSIKLIGEINEKLSVAPRRIDWEHPLSGIRGALNAITFQTSLAGEQTVIGMGAGGKVTSSAILSDIIDIAQTIRRKGD
jgi:homoserine dehydrogenase